jgi:uncharacterized repeat protein (TIGR02543 family)
MFSQGLIAYYPFNGNANDASGNGNNGTVNGATLTTDRFGNANSAYNFDGTNDYIDIKDDPVLNFKEALSVSFWVNPNVWMPSMGIISKKSSDNDNGFVIYNDGHFPGHPNIRYKGEAGLEGLLPANSIFDIGVWQQWTVTYDGKSVVWYKNGVLDKKYDSVVVSGDMANNVNLHIGHGQTWDAYGQQTYFSGIIDDIRIYNHALSNLEITDLYSRERPYTVIFSAGTGGTLTGQTTQTVSVNGSCTQVVAAPNTGYHFVNWTGGITSTSNPLTIQNVTANMTVTANFAINTYTVTFNLNGKGARTGGGNLVQTVNHGNAATAPTLVASPGWTFTGWDKAFDNISSELTVNAQYSAATYTVTYDAEGGTVSPPSKIVTYNAAYGTLDIPTRNGYTFAAWWTGDNGTGTQVTQMTTVINTANHTIYAKWTVNSYTVTYDAQGGTGSPASKSVTFGSAYGALPSPARNGYAFAGWWTGVNGTGTKLSSATIVSNAANHSIYAKWVVSAVGVALETPIPPEFKGLKVTVKGLPAGLRYDVSSGKIIGVPTKPGVYIVEISAPGVPTRTITISAGALPLWAQGTFDGTVALDLIDNADSWNNYPGTATMTVTSLGKITGKLSAGGKSCTFTAASYSPTDEAGVLGFEAIAKIGTTSVPLSFRVSQPTVLLGSKADGTYEGTDIKCEIHMYRNVWKDSDMLSVLADYVGYYTAVLPGVAEYGSGYLAMTVDKTGGIKTTGKLADGTALSLSGTLIFRNEPACVFAVIYASPASYQGGCIFGLAEFVKLADHSYLTLNPMDDIPFIWENRNAHATSVNGGIFKQELELTGGWYKKVGNLHDYYQYMNLTLDSDPGAVDPVLTVGAYPYDSAWWNFTDILLKPITNSSGFMTGISAPSAGLPSKISGNKWDYGDKDDNTVGLKIGFNRATGIFKGSFKSWFDYGTTHTYKSISYEGVLTPERNDKEDGVEGRGFFLWSDPSPGYPFKWSYDLLILGNP